MSDYKCAACFSPRVVIRGRVAHCNECEIVYYIPAPELAKRLRASLSTSLTIRPTEATRVIDNSSAAIHPAPRDRKGQARPSADRPAWPGGHRR